MINYSDADVAAWFSGTIGNIATMINIPERSADHRRPRKCLLLRSWEACLTWRRQPHRSGLASKRSERILARDLLRTVASAAHTLTWTAQISTDWT